VVKVTWSSLQPFLIDLPVWQTDRQMDARQHMRALHIQCCRALNYSWGLPTDNSSHNGLYCGGMSQSLRKYRCFAGTTLGYNHSTDCCGPTFCIFWHSGIRQWGLVVLQIWSNMLSLSLYVTQQWCGARCTFCLLLLRRQCRTLSSSSLTRLSVWRLLPGNAAGHVTHITFLWRHSWLVASSSDYY